VSGAAVAAPDESAADGDVNESEDGSVVGADGPVVGADDEVSVGTAVAGVSVAPSLGAGLPEPVTASVGEPDGDAAGDARAAGSTPTMVRISASN
jgi:hypothetical protein